MCDENSCHPDTFNPMVAFLRVYPMVSERVSVFRLRLLSWTRFPSPFIGSFADRNYLEVWTRHVPYFLPTRCKSPLAIHGHCLPMRIFSCSSRGADLANEPTLYLSFHSFLLPRVCLLRQLGLLYIAYVTKGYPHGSPAFTPLPGACSSSSRDFTGSSYLS